jgi:hypothetical protein
MLAIYGIAMAVFASKSANSEIPMEVPDFSEEVDQVTFITAGNLEHPVKLSTALKFDSFKVFYYSGFGSDKTRFDLVDVSSECFTNMIKFIEMEESEPMQEIEKPLKSNWLEVIQKKYADFVMDLSLKQLLELTVASASIFAGDKVSSGDNMVDNHMHTLCAARLASMLKFEVDPKVIANKFKLNYEVLLSGEEKRKIEKEFAAIVAK